MPLPKSINAYEDVREVSERALNSERGVKVEFSTPGAAVHFRQRFYRFRLLDASENTKIYPADHPLHMKSAYDGLKARVEGTDVLIEKVSVESLKVVEL